jgi:hypothetical protein
MGLLINRAKANCNAAGTGAVTPGAAVSKFRTWAASGAQAGFRYDYLVEQGADWEMGVGLYNGTTITRGGPGVDPWFESSTGSLLSVTASDTIACVANQCTLQAGGLFMPPMKTYFPTTVIFGSMGLQYSQDKQAGLILYPNGNTLSGDYTSSIHKTITASGNWTAIARIDTLVNGGGQYYYGGIYIRDSSSRMVAFGWGVDSSGIPRGNIHYLNANTNGWLGSAFNNVALPQMPKWFRVDYNASASQFGFAYANDNGSGWNYINGNLSRSSIGMTNAPNTLGIGFTTNINASWWPYCTYTYWWDNA